MAGKLAIPCYKLWKLVSKSDLYVRVFVYMCERDWFIYLLIFAICKSEFQVINLKISI